MTEFNAKKYLSEIRFIDKDIRSRQSELDKLRQSVAINTSSLTDDKVQESHHGNFDDRYMKLLEVTREINKKIDNLVDVKVRVSNEIDLIDGRVSRLILRERYLNFRTFKEIADILGYELRYTHKLHGIALLEFKKRHFRTLNDTIDI